MTAATSAGWVVARSRVRLAGRIAGAETATTSGCVPTLAAVAGARRYQACMRPDGIYFFLDLPEGNYALSGRDHRGQAIGPHQVTVPAADAAGPAQIVVLDLKASAPSDVEEPPLDTPAANAPGRRRRGSRSAR